MTPLDYKNAAKKHLDFCLKWMEVCDEAPRKCQDFELLEIFYLAGYVAECLTIYVIYKVGGWNPAGINDKPRKVEKDRLSRDIQEYFDPVFTHYTKFDFYPNSIPPNNKEQIRTVHRLLNSIKNETSGDQIPAGLRRQIMSSGLHYIWKWVDGKSVNMSAHLEECIDGGLIGTGSLRANFFVSGHNFQNAICKVISPKLASRGGLDSVTFFASFKQCNEISYILLSKWKPSIRYFVKYQIGRKKMMQKIC